ncbi:S locus-related glycoprotein 1 binding pollen coat protein [Arabidopsis thaliana x Arabidopsis arenosa]|uniref:S locus-related glycoprotein 1 binding pollen coat protein n=2 Tax=Arabidopsis TaxID=3701 RepID=A0A8T2AF35_ARASU|nr:S locus-related glycoprotein 1 binding pollen coat protein [Arabidopsis thaliana x Arabidopsis arenosa]KAG7572353.1 S locus-related glycoprotein 1 binding pollen coat protein [Arabidopsis suecica]
MAKISCSHFFILMLVFSVFSVVEKAKGYQTDKYCTIILDPKTPCDLVDCRLNCYSGYNGVGKCIASKAGRTPNCVCTYNC